MTQVSPLPLLHLTRHNLGHGDEIVLRDVDVRLHQGERIALLGASGAGKSTLLEALRSALHVAHVPAAWCPQRQGLVPQLSVYHNIFMGRLDQHSRLTNLLNLLRPKSAHWQTVATLCEPLGIASLMERSVEALSGGQRQRVAIARALYQGQALFLGDEPVASVDQHQASELIQLIHSLHLTSIVALHQRELALTHFTRVIGLGKNNEGHGAVLLDIPTDGLTLQDLDCLYPAASSAGPHSPDESTDESTGEKFAQQDVSQEHRNAH
ncbi:ATP-binding cassette domain-containing protein [Cobetia crustatorum]|uniref:ATP-binding cassette domain-containing protein n=1 Tax=Cobetia crustatorum TaxID=553385 RepID=A0A558HXN3_9GAMM|nr:ATP-binding cassette domain-containing protein [Cobetia crustatorum]TVU73881.1 ATP-binding cassette domain-containing protein [Cobetia crustatorum]